MRVVEQYIRELGQIAENAKVSVVPTGVAEVQSVVAGLGKVSEKMRSSAPADFGGNMIAERVRG